MIDKRLFMDIEENNCWLPIKDKIAFKKEIIEYNVNYLEKKMLPDLIGKTVMVGERQYPKIYKIIKEICNLLECDYVQAYIYEDFFYSVESKGIGTKWLEISAKTIEDFTDKQLIFLIAKELYNIKFEYTYYSTLLVRSLKNIDYIPLIGKDIISESLKLSIYKWHRIANFSSDNFGMIMCGSLSEAINAILLTILNSKLLVSNVNILDFLKQAENLNSLDDEIYINTKADEIIPYGPFRIKKLICYSSSLRAKEAKQLLNI